MKKTLTLFGLSLSLLSGCGPSPAPQPPQAPLEMLAPLAPVVRAGTLSAQAGTAPAGVKVSHTYTFRDGSTYDYVTYGDQVVDGDVIMGPAADLERELQDADGRGLGAQGAMTNRCTYMVFGGCFGTWQGVKWTGNSQYSVVYFEPLQPTFTDSEARLIADAMWEITMANPAIRFAELSGMPNHIRFTRYTDAAKGGCWSHLGMQGGEQELNLGTGCLHKGVILHELLHALGAMHEHSRPDRDNYLSVNTSNLTEYGKQHIDFKYWTRDLAPGQYTDFDLGSIMMYPQYIWNTGFVIDPYQPAFTLKVPLPDGVVVGQRDGLSALDIQTLKLRYKSAQ